MPFTDWLQKLRSMLAPHRGGRTHQRRGAARPLSLDVLEDRALLSFSPIASYALGPNPQGIVAAHFNNDAVLDLAVANYDTGEVSVLLGNPAAPGQFQAPVNYAAGYGTTSLAVGDLDGDLDIDIATANAGDLSVLLNDGQGGFAAPASINLGANPTSVAVGDFNGDGMLDLAMTSNIYTLQYYYGGWYYYYYYPTYSYEGQAHVLLGNGPGAFSESYTASLGTGYHLSAAVEDFNRDGNDDLATLNSDYGTVSVLLGASAGAPLGAAFGYNTGWYPQAVTVGDFTGDGILDLATAGQTVDILPGYGDGTFRGVVRQYIDPVAITAADFNNDGNLDVVTANYGDTVSALLGRGDGTLLPPIDIAAGGSGARAVAAGDFNGDGRPDVASVNVYSNSVSILLNDGIWLAADAPSITIADRTLSEGNSGTTAFTFTVSLSAAYRQTVTVQFTTGDGSATLAAGDYQQTSGTVTFAPGETSKSVSILVNGDRLVESSETFFVSLSNPTNAFITDGTAVGTITDDEPRISINDVTKYEGKNRKTTQFTFTVTLSNAYDHAVTMSFQTVNGTATTGDNDYFAKSGTLTFAPGETTKTITIEVKGDNRREASETFYLDLSGNSSNSSFTKNRGTGQIINDD